MLRNIERKQMRTISLPNEELLPEICRMLAEGISVTLRGKGDSMRPFIVNKRDSVVLRKAGKLQCGDIVLAEVAPQKYVLHRIIRMENGQFILRGDGNLYGTEQCDRQHISGYVTAIVRKGKQVDCSAAGERLKVQVWQALLPVRRYLLTIYKQLMQ